MREERSDEAPPPCRFCQGTGSVEGQMCGDCCGLAVDCVDWYQAIAYERARADRAEAALRYIASPTMGLPGGVDAAEFAMSGAREDLARIALANCIRQARAALARGKP